ncbi:MAG: hypothetical protein WA426_12515, partial [Silvibacterium sp.]
GNRCKFQDSLYAPGGDSFHVVLQDRHKEWIVFPLGMLRSHRLHAIEDERKLESQRLLAPQGSIVIEDRDAFFGFDELRAASRGHSTDKIQDALLG